MNREEKYSKFIEEYTALCKKNGLTISHEDSQGSFIIEDFDEYDIEWMQNAMNNISEEEIIEEAKPDKGFRYMNFVNENELCEFLNSHESDGIKVLQILKKESIPVYDRTSITLIYNKGLR